MTVDSVPRVQPRQVLPPVLDLVCLIAFVFAGAGQHDVDQGLGWFLTVLWPLAVAWFGVAFVTRLYTYDDQVRVRFAVTVAAGVLVHAVLRWAFTDRPLVSVVTVVLAAWVVVTAGGWRALVLLVERRRAVA